jgi:kynurenine 3-monooxygenase
MRHDVTTASFRLRKMLDGLLYEFGGHLPETVASLLPRFRDEVYPSSGRGWMPLYTMVTFRPDIGYAAAKSKAERQTRILNTVGLCAGFFGVASLALAYHRFRSRW